MLFFSLMFMVSRRLFLLTTLAITCTGVMATEPAYMKLKTPLPNSAGTLTKIFSYDCPFCYRYDNGVDAELAKKAAEVAGLKFNPVFLENRAKYGKTATLFLAYCSIEDKKAGRSVTDKESLFSRAKNAMYFSYLKEKNRWEGGKSDFLRTLTEATGISEETFTAHSKDPEVLALRDAWRPVEAVAAIQGIPAYVVNGRYLILNKVVRSKNELTELVEKLAKLP